MDGHKLCWLSWKLLSTTWTLKILVIERMFQNEKLKLSSCQDASVRNFSALFTIALEIKPCSKKLQFNRKRCSFWSYKPVLFLAQLLLMLLVMLVVVVDAQGLELC